MKLFKPEIFQGNLKKRRYFEGWYFKNVTHDLNEVYAFIPGISLNTSDSHAFIQIINGLSGDSHYIRYPLSDFWANSSEFQVKIRENVFHAKGMKLHIDSEEIRVGGELNYSGILQYPRRLFSPGIMGWYSFVPFMECKHGVVSVDHQISGELLLNDERIDFTGGRGYIEKDWGSSFPEAWIWLQSNNFSKQPVSTMLSIAKIPWLGNYFMGFISFLYCQGRFYLFSSYNGSFIDEVSYSPQLIRVVLKNKEHMLKYLIRPAKAGELIAPSHGEMNRMIKESVDSEVSIELQTRRGELLFRDSGKRAGLEVSDTIFQLLNAKEIIES